MNDLTINDCHLGVKRQGGTTKQSRAELEAWMLQQFKAIVHSNTYGKLFILGDLFDKRNVEEHVMLEVINILKTVENCYIVAGNHDLGGIEDHTICSAEFVAKMSGARWVSEPLAIGNFYIIPHLHNQDEYDAALREVPHSAILLTHANIDSPWAQSDHSLNLSKEQIVGLRDKDVKVIAGHEHGGREYMDNVFVIGNQFPSSIADCLSGDKRAFLVSEKGEIKAVPTWSAEEFVTQSWESGNMPDGKFIKISGQCSLEDAPSAIRRVNEIRKSSDAFIVSNGVEVISDQITVSSQEVDQFNIAEMFMGFLPKKIRLKVEEVI